jgi:predicted choloylglycine hydrolase
MVRARVVDLPAAGWEAGVAHGEELRDVIIEGVEGWKSSLAADGEHPERWIERFLASTDFRPAMARWTPELLEEIAGLSASSGIDEATMFAYQLVDEQWTFQQLHQAQQQRQAQHEHCSTLGIEGAPGEAPVIAQNLDLPLWFEGLQVVLRLAAGDGRPGCTIVTSAGFIVMNGANDAGLGLGVNTLPDVATSTSGLPVACAVRGALNKHSAAEAIAFLSEVPHASGQHYLVGDPSGITGIECDAEGADLIEPHGGVVAHTNHALLRPTCDTSVAGVPPDALAFSRRRLDFLVDAAPRLSAATPSATADVLSDCSVPIRRSAAA